MAKRGTGPSYGISMPPKSPNVGLNDGARMPQLGLGLWQAPDEDAAQIVGAAVDAGYRLFDTAAAYRNERGVGEGLASAGVERDKLFITTKLWNDNQGYDAALVAFDKSLMRLRLEAVDLYLVHWPAPKRDLYVETWRALIRLKEEGRARSIGVSNFEPEHLQRLMDETGVAPAVNQIEVHPRFQQRRLREFHARFDIRTQSWSPLGTGTLLDDSTVGAIAKKHSVTPAQTIIRWHIENDLIVIPKSTTPARIRENTDVFDLRLDEDDMARLAQLDTPDGRIGPDPMTAPF